MGSGREDSTWPIAERLQARLRESRILRQMSLEARGRALATRERVRRGRAQRQISHDPAYARLQARYASMPVLEQAKGIIMAQRRCGPKEASDLLRQASERANIKVRALAAQVVDQVACRDGGGNVIPIALGAVRHPRPRMRARPPAG